MFNLLSHSDEFALNFDLLETNVLNLSVVVGVLVYYGRVVFSDMVNSYKSLVVKSLQEVETKLGQAELNLSTARNNFELAKLKADEIRSQGILLSSQTKNALLLDLDSNIKRLQLLGLNIVRMEEENSVGEMCQRLLVSAIMKSRESLLKRMNLNLHKKVILQNIDKLTFKYILKA